MQAGELNLNEWYKPNIDKKILKELSKRSDWKGIRHAIIFFSVYNCYNLGKLVGNFEFASVWQHLLLLC